MLLQSVLCCSSNISDGVVQVSEKTILLNKAYEILSDPKKRSRFDEELRQQSCAKDRYSNPDLNTGETEREPHQPEADVNSADFAANGSRSFATATSSKVKQSRNATLLTVVGILLGALTAIPIGLFLVWTISGFDPVGIFRQNEDQEIAEREEQQKQEVNQSVDEKKRIDKAQKASSVNDATANSQDARSGETGNVVVQKDKVTISYAKFGESRQSVRVESFVEDVANKADVETTITTEGLNTTNPVGRPQELLRVTYQVNNEKTGTLVFSNGETVNIREEILKHAKVNGRPYQKIEIVYALFGKRSNKVRCEEQVAAVASQIDTVSPITTHGLSLRNPSGIVRHELDIQYKVAGKTGALTLKYGDKVDLRKKILEHANVFDGSYTPTTLDGNLSQSTESTKESKNDASDKSQDADLASTEDIPKDDSSIPKSLVDNRRPIPSATAIKSAKSKIAAIFKSDYEMAKRATGPTELGLLYALAKEVIKLTENESDPDTLYAAFEVAIDIARESCHEGLFLEFVRQFELQFKVDGLQRRAELLSVMRRDLPLAIRNKDKVKAVANKLRQTSKILFRKSIDEERWSIAKEICINYRGFCLLCGEKQRAAALKKALSLLEKKEVEATRFARYVREEKAGSRDPEKLLAIGKFLCFTKQEWRQGLTYLADANDINFSKLAAADLVATESDFMSLGDRWWELAFDAEFFEQRIPLLTRAKHFYWLAMDKSSGLDKTKIEKRLKEANLEIWRDGFFFDYLNNSASPSTGMKLIQVKSGSFEMGEFQKNVEAFGKHAKNYQHETPRHAVTITNSFYMGQYEVTQDQWFKVMGTQPWATDEIYGREAHYPAAFVSWNDAQEFCRKLSVLDKRKYRLPTEAEWEFACRAGTVTRFYVGDPTESILPYEWVRDNAYDKMGWRSAQLVGTKLPNPYGFYDMLGNLYEWCQDTHEPDFYSRSPRIDPTNNAAGPWKVCRSGSIYGSSWTSRSASRQKAGPHEKTRVIGFRVVMEK